MNVPVRSVAVIGVGSMGAPIARRIAEAGFEVTVCDVNPANLEPFAGSGTRTTTSPTDCVACGAVIILVATPEQMRAVVSGPNGLTSSPTGGPPYLVVMSTVSPGDVRDLAASLSGTATRVVDAPVSGGVMNARTGKLTIMAGGAEADVAALQPLFAALGSSVFHCGELGAGQATKITNNIVAIANLMISAEAYRIALGLGLTFDRLMPVLEASSGRNFLSRDSAAVEAYGVWSRSTEDFEAFQSINRKDIDLALASAGPGVALPAVTALRALLDTPIDAVLPNWQVSGEAARLEPIDVVRNLASLSSRH